MGGRPATPPATRTAGGVTYTLTRRRVRNLNLRVRADGSVAVSAAPGVPAGAVDAFVAGHAAWVAAAQARAAARRAAEAAPRPPQAEALARLRDLTARLACRLKDSLPGGQG